LSWVAKVGYLCAGLTWAGVTLDLALFAFKDEYISKVAQASTEFGSVAQLAGLAWVLIIFLLLHAGED